MKWAFFVFLGLYVVAFLLFLTGTFGWFGQDEDALSGVFLLPLGLPWNILMDRIGVSNLVPMLLAPAINLGILFWLWKK